MKSNDGATHTPPPIKRSRTKKIILISSCVLGGLIILPVVFLLTLEFFFGGSEESEPDKSIWSEQYLTDVFGASTKEKYLYTDLIGSFSNSATTNSDLRVRLTVEKDSTIEIALYEYGCEIVKDQKHSMKVRQNDSIIYNNEYLDIRRNGWGYLSYRENERHICHTSPFLYDGGKIEFVLTEKRDYRGVPSTYKFTIEDASIIKDALNILNTQDK